MDVDRKPFFGRERVIFEIVQGLWRRSRKASRCRAEAHGQDPPAHYLAADEGRSWGSTLRLSAHPPFRVAAGAGGLGGLRLAGRPRRLDRLGLSNLQEAVRVQARVDLDWARIESQPSASRRIWQVARALSERRSPGAAAGQFRSGLRESVHRGYGRRIAPVDPGDGAPGGHRAAAPRPGP